MPEYIEREAIEKAVLIKREQERQHWIEHLKQYRGTSIYSSKEQAVDNWLRGYGEAVENLLAIFETIPAADVVEVVRCKDCKYGDFYCGSILCGNAHAPWYNDEFDATMELDDFCSYGERKEGAEGC